MAGTKASAAKAAATKAVKRAQRYEVTYGRTTWAIQSYEYGWQIERGNGPEAYFATLPQAAAGLARRADREMPTDLAVLVEEHRRFEAALRMAVSST